MASRWWHGVLFVVVAASFVAQLVLVFQGGVDVNAGTSTARLGLGTRLINLFSYFTIQSNLLVLVVAGTLLLDPGRDGRIWRVVRLDALLGIAITGIVFATILAGQVHHEGVSVWINAGLHYFSPCWALAGWLLFGPRPRITSQVIAWSFAWPAAWIGYTFIRGAVTGWYPYPFLNVAEIGYLVAIRNTVIVLILAALVATLLSWGDRKLVTRFVVGAAEGLRHGPRQPRSDPTGQG